MVVVAVHNGTNFVVPEPVTCAKAVVEKYNTATKNAVALFIHSLQHFLDVAHGL
jgi:hypothetical protein